MKASLSCCGRLPVLIRKHQLQMIEIRKSLLTMMLKVTESVRDLFWKRCCGKVTSPCIKSWPLAAPASKQQQQWKTITIQWRWTPWCRCRSESPFTPSIISWALSVCIETRKKNNWASPLKSSKLWKQCADTRSGHRIRIILYLLHCICFLKKGSVMGCWQWSCN